MTKIQKFHSKFFRSTSHPEIFLSYTPDEQESDYIENQKIKIEINNFSSD